MIRPTALLMLRLDHFSQTRLVDEVFWKITGSVGYTYGSSKTQRGDLIRLVKIHNKCVAGTIHMETVSSTFVNTSIRTFLFALQ